MNGVHDLGGMHGFGPVVPEPDEPVFHAPWERRVLAVTLAVGALGAWNIDQSRFSRESLPPSLYLASSYYRIWLEALERTLPPSGLLDGTRDGSATPWPQLNHILTHGTSYDRTPEAPARFAAGEQVRTRIMHPAGHTRLPRFARGHIGTILLVHGAQVFPDRNAVPLGQRPDPRPEWLYAVEFAGTELWGPDSDPTVTVCVDAWEPYLEPVAA
ncbi:MAG: nitrile hydratase subunit beta [Tetrasphaera sp.]